MKKEILNATKAILTEEKNARIVDRETQEFEQKKNSPMYKSVGNFESYLEKKYGIVARGQNDCKKEGSMSRRIRSYI